MKKLKLLAGAVLFSLAGWSGAAAADQVYTLNPVVVTAQRMETTEIETPATETVVTAKKIEEAGYKNAFDIIVRRVEDINEVLKLYNGNYRCNYAR